MPIFSSIAPHVIGLRLPIEPSALGINLGVINSEIPLEPLGASGKRASTKWIMLAAMSCSPAEINILLPVILYEPSACGSALLRNIPKSVPQCGSVKHIVPVHSPDTNLGKYNACCSGVPCSCKHSYAPCDKPGYIVHA